MAKANRSKAASAALTKSLQLEFSRAHDEVDQASLVFAAIIDAATGAKGEAAIHAIRYAALHGHDRAEAAASIHKNRRAAGVSHG